MRSPAQSPGTVAADASSGLIHREIVQLVVLVAVAVAAFFLTRAIAANNRDMNLRDAGEWYERGQRQLAAGESDGAIEAFRHAAAKNRGNPRYVLALATALERARQDDAARSVLLALRETAPEDPAVNLQLARLAAGRQDVAEAARYYHNALYAAWPADRFDARRAIRLELVRFLLAHDQTSRAVGELEALSADLPDDAGSHVIVGQLFAAAGDDAHALDQFQRALRISTGDGAALAGAGQAALRLGDYAAARRFLRAAPDSMSGVAESREVAELVLSTDPFAARIGLAARRQRITDNIAYALDRLTACAARTAGANPEADRLRHDAGTFTDALKRSRTLEADTIESSLEIVDRIEQRAVERCPPATPRDRAASLVARLHGVGGR